MEIDFHFVRDHLISHCIATGHVSTMQQLADIFTKALGRDAFQSLLIKLGIRNLHALA